MLKRSGAFADGIVMGGIEGFGVCCRQPDTDGKSGGHLLWMMSTSNAEPGSLLIFLHSGLLNSEENLWAAEFLSTLSSRCVQRPR
jgi:hypothetical protein